MKKWVQAGPASGSIPRMYRINGVIRFRRTDVLDIYWRPALRKVHSGTAKESLVTASPKILRKAAITWWLRAGVSPTVAADWAGTEEVMQMYYASRPSTTWAVEAEILRRAGSAREGEA